MFSAPACPCECPFPSPCPCPLVEEEGKGAASSASTTFTSTKAGGLYDAAEDDDIDLGLDVDIDDNETTDGERAWDAISFAACTRDARLAAGWPYSDGDSGVMGMGMDLGMDILRRRPSEV